MNYKKWVASLLTATIIVSLGSIGGMSSKVGAAAKSAQEVVFYLDQSTAYHNEVEVTLDSPATAVNGKSYLPAKFLGDALGMSVTYNAESKTNSMKTADYDIEIDINNNWVSINGKKQTNNGLARIINGRIMVQLTWLCDIMGASYNYFHPQKKVTVTYIPKDLSLVGEESDPKVIGSIPIAKFTVDKKSYKKGETVNYTSLSYDPDGNASLALSWTGKQDAFFEAGEHVVSLVATDKDGNKSKAYSRTITVTNEELFSEFEYQVYSSKAGSYVDSTTSKFNSSVLSYSIAGKTVSNTDSRKLLVSDSPESITQLGILYQDSINGKARLYANHVNSMNQNIKFAILATNNTDKAITLKTTNKGEVSPSIYAQLLGNEAVTDFMMYDPVNESITIDPGETVVYKQYPTFAPGYGLNTIYDVESSGDLLMTFAVDSTVGEQMLNLQKLDFNGHVRGSFNKSDFYWDVDLNKVGKSKIQRIVIGDGTADPFLTGYDVQREETTTLKGNYGTVYHITIDNPGDMAVMVMARGGRFKGTFLVNNNFVRVPTSGTLTPFDGLITIAKTSTKDKSVTIEFSPPAGSSLPINLILYPLDSRVEYFK